MKIKYLLSGNLLSIFATRRLFKCALLILALMALALSHSAASAHFVSNRIQKEETRSLAPGTTIEREITTGKPHSYQITLASNQFLRVKAFQHDIDIFLKLSGPDGNQVAEAKNWLDPMRTERLSFVARDYGDYRLEVISLETEGTKGSYQLKVEPVRVAALEDFSLMQAEKLFSEAERLQAAGRAESSKQAAIKYEESLSLWRQADDKQGEADTLQYLAMIERMSGKTPKALEYLTEALSLYRAVEDRRGESQSLRGIGLLHHLSGDAHKALAYYDEALPISRALKDTDGEASVLNNLGGAYYYLGEHQKALEYYARALPLHRELNNKRAEATTLNNIGEIYRTLGEHPRALEYFDQSLTLRRANQDIRGEAVTLNNIALAYASMGEYQKALSDNDKALSLRRTAGDRFGEASTLGNIGFVYHKLGELDKALEFFKQALELRRAVGDRRGEANTLHHIGAVYASKGDTEKAIEYFNQSLPLSQAVWDRTVEAATIYSIARIERDRGNLADACLHMNAALDIIESLRSKVARQELRETFFASKQDHYELYIDILMQLRYEARAFEASERARARALLDILAESRADIRQGVDSSLLERERALQQQINSKEALRMQMASRRNTEEQLKAIEASLNDLLNEHKDIRAKIRANSKHYAALSDPQPLSAQEVQHLLDAQTLLLEYSLGDKQSYLWMVTQTSITGYTLAGREEIENKARRVYELLTARNRHTSTETSDQKRAMLAEADDKYQVAAAELSQMLLGPVGESLGNKRLIIIAEGALQYIPFGALPVPRSQESRVESRESKEEKSGSRQNSVSNLTTPDSQMPLVTGHEIVNLPSASVLALLREEIAERKQADKTVAVLADPVFDLDDPRLAIAQARIKNRQSTPIAKADAAFNDEWQRLAQSVGINKFRRLKFSRLEADAISDLAAQSHSMKAVDFAASRATAVSGALNRYRIIHFATHGLINTEQPELSGVVLSLLNEAGEPQDGFLRLHDIYNLRLGADLVVLSACRTALGKEIKGEGLVGLVRGFMYAGAPRVVASLWNVEDRATAELMKRFYKNMLSEKMAPAAALRSAQVSMWKEKRWQQPYFWAGFTLQGEWK